jgi:puromycin-sensitive aminopeptidase
MLHAATLAVDLTSISVSLCHIVDTDLRPRNMELIKEDEILVLEFGSQFPLGPSLLYIAFFTGMLNDEMRGSYRSKYQYKRACHIHVCHTIRGR